MEDPVREISAVIHSLTQTPPSVQQDTINTYFTRNASFIHPFVRTESWAINDQLNSRRAIKEIYRWYKILSPRIDLSVDSVAFDIHNLLLYVSISQNFRVIWIPFYFAPVKLVTVLSLVQDKQTQRYYIKQQQDLYQMDNVVRFFAPFGGAQLVWVWQWVATAVCWLMAILFAPVSWIEDGWGRGRAQRIS